jgi:hypothetical protein
LLITSKELQLTKAVVKIGGQQFVVAEKETLLEDLLPE